MKKKTARAAAKPAPAPRKKAPSRRLVLKPEAISPEEVTHIEAVVKRFEESERAWQRMTAAPDEDDKWSSVEEHLLTQREGDADRRWKFFSK